MSEKAANEISELQQELKDLRGGAAILDRRYPPLLGSGIIKGRLVIAEQPFIEIQPEHLERVPANRTID
jgi:hypothetical protein